MAKYTLIVTSEFKKTFKLCQKRGLDMSLLKHVIDILEEEGKLPNEYRPHKLTNKKGNATWECHVKSDWLLVWQQNDSTLTLIMVTTGTHSDMFYKNKRYSHKISLIVPSGRHTSKWCVISQSIIN